MNDLPIVKRVIQDAAERCGVDPQLVTVIDIEQRNWPSSALGVNKEGYMYLQVITPGLMMHLIAGDERLTYHTDNNERFVLAPGEQP